MQSFKSYLDEEKKKPGILRRIFPKKASEKVNKTQWDSRKSKKPVDYREAEAKLNKDMGWDTNNDEGK
jgi:hypothetical protein